MVVAAAVAAAAGVGAAVEAVVVVAVAAVASAPLPALQPQLLIELHGEAAFDQHQQMNEFFVDS